MLQGAVCAHMRKALRRRRLLLADCQRESSVLTLPDLPTTNQQQSRSLAGHDPSPRRWRTIPDSKLIWMRVGYAHKACLAGNATTGP